MLKRTSILTALAVGAGLWTAQTASAASFWVEPQAPYAESANSMMIPVAQYNDRRVWNRDHDGPRCRYRRGDCRHFYRGYYYVNPWWLVPPVVIGGSRYYEDDYYDDYPVRSYGRRHVEWCMDRYRSYNPRTNTWVSYSGDIRQCVSPYS